MTPDAKLKEMFLTTELTMAEMGNAIGYSPKMVWSRLHTWFTKEEITNRKRKCYSNSKLGDKNPMLGKTAEKSPSYKGRISDCKGYLLILKPRWYTGRPKSNHIFFHHMVMCEALSITEIPKGFVVHHIDKNPLNNDISNLLLMSNSAHMKLHALERKRATTRDTSRTSEANADGSALHSCGNE